MGHKTKQDDPGEHLFRYFKKRTTSFYASIYKAGITASKSDVHKARVDLKKVFALLSFFELFGNKDITSKKLAPPFKKVFSAAGQLRDTHVQLVTLKKMERDLPAVKPIIVFLSSCQKERSKGFLKAVLTFNNKRLKETNRVVKEICLHLTSEEIDRRCLTYIRKRAQNIRNHLPHIMEPENLHSVRKELKKMGAVVALLGKIHPEGNKESLTIYLEKAEKEIGAWHDQIVLLETVNTFLNVNHKMDEALLKSIEDLREEMVFTAHEKVARLLPIVEEVVFLVEKQE